MRFTRKLSPNALRWQAKIASGAATCLAPPAIRNHASAWRRTKRAVPAKAAIRTYCGCDTYAESRGAETAAVAATMTRVHRLIDKTVWTARYDRIREFETLLAETGTTVLKFFLHISKAEQLVRFAARLDDPTRNWKISDSDYAERAHWEEYREAYEEALARTSTASAPWYAIPADHKWFRNLAVSQIVAETLHELGMSYPKPSVDLAEIRRRYQREARSERNPA
jgi:hypothetical protein